MRPYTVNVFGIKCQLQHEPAGELGMFSHIVATQNRHVVIGYLAQDDFCAPPMSDNMGDSLGRLHWYRRRGEEPFWELLTSTHRLKKPHSFFMEEVSEEYGRISLCTVRNLEACCAESTAIWIPTDCLMEHIQSTAITTLCEDKLQVKWESPGQGARWTLADGQTKGGYRKWMVAVRAGQKALKAKFDRRTILREEVAVARKCALEGITEYNLWAEHEVYGVVVEEFDKHGKCVWDDSCFGYVGYDYATRTMEDEVASRVKRIQMNLEEAAALRAANRIDGRPIRVLDF